MINRRLRLLSVDNWSAFSGKAAVLIGALACLPAAAVAQTTWNVPGDFGTIQDAIDAGTVVNGDTIQVAAGEYSNPAGTGFGPQLFAMSIQKELTIQGAGNDSNPAIGTVFAPFSAGGQATNGAVFMDANNIVFRDIYIDGQKNQDPTTGQVVSRGFQAGGSNLLIENVTVVGTVHSCIELNQADNSTLRNVTIDTTVAGYNTGSNARGLRIVSSDNVLVENLTALGPAPNPFDGSGYYLVGFQDTCSYTLRNCSMTGGAGNFGQYIYVPFLPDNHTITYEGSVVIEDAPVGINIAEDPSGQVTLNTSAGVVQFANVAIPLQRDGLGVVNNLEDFVCQSGIPYRSTVGTQERYFATLAEAQADASANGGIADEITCSPPVAQSPLTTSFASNNGGGVGGAVYFNLTTGASDVCIAAFGLNSGSSAGTSGTCQVWTISGGTYVGNTSAGTGAWGGMEATSGALVAAGQDLESFCALNSALVLPANTTTAIALEATGFSHRYMNGTGGSAGVPGSSINSTFGDPLELLFEGGAANNTAFSSSTFDPRIANISIYYALGSGPCVAAAANTYGVGCYDGSVSYYEEFAAGASDITGTVGVETVSILHTPNAAGGYSISGGPGTWFGDDGSGVTNGPNASAGIAPLSTPLATGDDAITLVDLAVEAPGFVWQPVGTSGPQINLEIDSNGRVIPGTGGSSDFSPSIAELLNGAGGTMAPAWGDMSPNIQGTLHFDYDGSSCYVTWADVPWFGAAAGNPGNNIQVALHADGSFEYRYAGIAASGSYLVGFSSGNGANDPGPSDIHTCLDPLTGPCDLGGFSAPLALSASGRPVQGTSTDLEVTGFTATATAVIVRVSFTQDEMGTDLGAYGMAGCNGYIDILGSAFSYVAGLPGGDPVTFSFANPADPAYTGATLYFQAGALDPSAPNAIGATASNGLAYRLGDI